MKLEIEPMGAVRMTYNGKWQDRPQRYLAWQNELAWLARAKDFTLPNIFDVTFVLAMPKSWSQSKKDKYRGKPHQQKPDLDNLEKAFIDALRKDDQAIYSVHKSKYWWDYGCILVSEDYMADSEIEVL